MNMVAVKAKAKEMGIQTAKMRKAELIRAIQQAEGHFPCFETAKDYCDQMDCCWREDCLPQ
ncbi:MAG: Rho termination factor N-terminal domain-containing protein [Desulfobulbaceae bacterium]|nr:Rho termination factor N-terminal domain-containing protein [Desulfobulbaceae bacterium]HIJ78477.1 SAP domain-containing protein [Deltaproteobacteria bacterium]